jgi:hypothetical protein
MWSSRDCSFGYSVIWGQKPKIQVLRLVISNGKTVLDFSFSERSIVGSFSKEFLNLVHCCLNFLTSMYVDCKRVGRTVPWNLVSLIFRGPYIVIYSYNKGQRDTISQIYLIKYSTCFGQVQCPSSGLPQHCVHAIGICHASSVDCLLTCS